MNDRLSTSILAIGIAAIAIGLGGCGAIPEYEQTAATTPDEAKIPITTSSEEARNEFLQGRDLAERLLAQRSIQHFDRAISLDPDFALAELGRANASPTAKEFFEHLNKAVELSGKVSEGERLLILASEAAANADPANQREYLEKLAASFPQDERAHFSLGTHFFGRQNYTEAVKHFESATEISPEYSTAYNMMGYAHRQMGNYADAEQAFVKYTELIPDDPNPYDSYAELLLKMGRHEESIEQYKKALALDPNFVASHVGIAANLMYMDKMEEASAELQKIADTARNDGERRTALFGMAVLAADSGQMDAALAQVEKQYALAEKINDAAAMSGDLQLKGNILYEMGKFDLAREAFGASLQIIESSSLSEEIKDNARLLRHFNLAVVARGKKDFATAKSEAEEFRKGAEASANPSIVRQAHELMGRIALAENDYSQAVSELLQASQQNSYNLYRLSLAYEGMGDAAKAKEFCKKAAEFNPLPAINHAFIRTKAEERLENMS